MKTDLEAVLHRLVQKAPEEKVAFDQWLEQSDLQDFLLNMEKLEEVPLYVSDTHLFLHGVLVPNELLDPPDMADLSNWGTNPCSTWGICGGFNDDGEDSPFLCPPLDHAGSRTIEMGEQLVFVRDFDGRIEEKSYVEIAQRLTHPFGLHYVPERTAYCRFDSNGDLEEVIRIIALAGSARDAGRAVTIDRRTLEGYMVITNQSLLLMIDSNRFQPASMCGFAYDSNASVEPNPNIFFRFSRCGQQLSTIRGAAIIRNQLPGSDLFTDGDTTEKHYEEFLAFDWKHREVRMCSVDPSQLGNYFVPSDFPYGTSPAFFRSEVLQKYKADSEKYLLLDRSISRKHAWHLKTYDVNEAGQIHTYLVYLGQLPHEEQVYWKSFNEPPKGPISSRAYKTDFLAEWDLEKDPLNDLRNTLLDLERKRVDWWVLRDRDLPNLVHYPVTASPDEWIREIHALDKLLIEGFDVQALRVRASAHGITFDKEWKSIKLIDELLSGLGIAATLRSEIVEPLKELHKFRSKLSGHLAGDEARKIRKSVLTTHRDYRVHFRQLCTACQSAIVNIAQHLS